MEGEYERAQSALKAILSKLPEEHQKPRVAIICGTGLGGIAEVLEPKTLIEIPYEDIPHFRVSTVVGHSGKLLFGFMGEKKVPVVCMSGRVHTYEGYPIKDTVFPVRVFALLKVEILIATNASGGVNSSFNVGDLMVLSDHIDFPGMAGQNALKGPNDERFGPRFCALSDAYDHDLRYSFFEAAKELGVTRPIHEGVYAFLSGPNYETRAEIRMLRIMGVDCVGMSTVPEIVTARHSGMRTFAVSLVTNVAVHDKYPSGRQQLESSLSAGKANHEEVIEAGKQAAKDIQRIIASFVGEL